MDLFRLDGKKALITGGNGGIGQAIAAALRLAGAEIAIVGRSDSVYEVARELSSPNRICHAIRADLSKRADTFRAFDAALAALGTLDILVTAHGVANIGDAADYPLERWDETLEINLNSVWILCQLAGRVMLAKGRGKIINIASMLSFSGGLRVPAYAASKGGISQLTMALGNEWARHGVNVNAIAPGYIKTPMNPHIWQDPTRLEQILARIPIGRMGEPSDMGGAAVFLASAASDYLSGVILPVDGGFLAR
ncbi:MAG: 2-dehydro-3-deoxy-D-gluconate 5-dehydrogenase KduD [Anaerolineae bacterium]